MCFIAPYIGLRGPCEIQNPTSNLYFNDLPGVTFRRGSLSANEEDLTSKAMFERISALAVEEVKEDFLQSISHRYNFDRVLSRETFGRFDDNSYQTYNSGVGVEMEQCIKDPYSSLFIESVDIWSQSGGSITVTVTDGIQTEACDVNLATDGFTNVRLGFESSQEKITITHTGGTFRVSDSNWYACDFCESPNAGLTVRGLEDGVYKGTYFGMRIRAQRRCSKDAFLCNYEDLLRRAILYKAGIKFLHEAIFTDRFNRFVANGKDQLERLLIMWNGGIDPVTGYENRGEYWRNLKGAISQLERSFKSEKSNCISCKGWRRGLRLP